MSIYTPPALSAVDFALESFTPANLTPAGTALSVYSIPALSAVDFALSAYTQPTYPDVGWELLGGGTNITLPLTGVGSTAGVGTLAPLFSLALSSVSGAGSAGSVTPGATIALTGVPSAAGTGTLSPAHSIGLSGSVAMGDVGNLGPVFTLDLSGNVSSGGVGTFGTSGAPVTAALTGVSATASAGDMSVVVTSPNSIASARTSFESKRAGETADYYFSFENVLFEGETIVAARTVTEYYYGPESDAGPVVDGPAVVQGGIVKQRFSGGVSGTVYIVTCSIQSSLGDIRRLSAYLVIL